MTDAQEAELRRLVTEPTLVSDGSLRMTIANLLGWQIDVSYFTSADKPWGHGYAQGVVNDRLGDLEEAVSLIRGHLVL